MDRPGLQGLLLTIPAAILKKSPDAASALEKLLKKMNLCIGGSTEVAILQTAQQ